MLSNRRACLGARRPATAVAVEDILGDLRADPGVACVDGHKHATLVDAIFVIAGICIAYAMLLQ